MTEIPNLALDSGLPAAVDAERTILGAVLLDNAALYTTEQSIREDDFSLDSHRRIYLRMKGLFNAGRSVDIVTLAAELDAHKERESIGGVAYLASLTEGLPRRPMIEEYIRIVKDKSLLRKLMLICSAGVARAADQGETALEVMGAVMSQLNSVEDSNLQGADLESVGQWLNQNDVFAERVPGIYTGIDDYDEMTFGLHPGELTVFAGRTSSGKTSHCGTIAWQMARRGKCVAAFINEQQKQSFAGRMLCGRAGVSFKTYRRGLLDWVEKQYIEDVVKEFKTLPIFWDQRSSMSVASIRAKAARLKRSGELDVILVDQLSRISNEGLWQKGMRSDEVIGEKVSAFKAMAVDLGVPVALYHQLNRETTKNEENRPTMVNLKGSGSIEEHADNVALFHRPGYYKKEAGNETDAEIIVAKQRDGETGIVHCEFIGASCLWRNKR
jgi:replicative DNA helicase